MEGVRDFMLALHDLWTDFLDLQGSGPLKLHALLQYQNYGCTVQY